MDKILEPFLPSATEIAEMDKVSFEMWVLNASKELPRRAEKRDPLNSLKKRISDIISDNTLSEPVREARILSEIERYERIKSR